MIVAIFFSKIYAKDHCFSGVREGKFYFTVEIDVILIAYYTPKIMDSGALLKSVRQSSPIHALPAPNSGRRTFK